MIDNAQDLHDALRGNKPRARGVILYRGPSQFNGEPIVVIMNRLVEASENKKTGRLVQTFILSESAHPVENLYNGADASICGDCIHRYNPKTLRRSCYVEVGKSVAKVWHSINNGRYLEPEEYSWQALLDYMSDKKLRIGTYGDPGACPSRIWLELAAHSQSYLGYTHAWRSTDWQLSAVCMASVDSLAEQQHATMQGWRTFRVRDWSAPLPSEIDCPAPTHGVQCSDCGLCAGASKKAKSITIPAHGIGKSAYKEAA